MENEKAVEYVIGDIDAARPKSYADTMRGFEEAILTYNDLVRRSWVSREGILLRLLRRYSEENISLIPCLCGCPSD